MPTSPLAISFTSVVSGINTVAAETGVAIFGGLVAALSLVLIGAVWRRARLSFRGSRAVGTVTRTEPAGPRMCRAYISFQAGDGREVSAALNAPQRVRTGDRLDIWYDPAKPEFATDLSAPAVVARLLPLAALAAVGLTGLAGTLYTSAKGGFDAFSNGYIVVVFVVAALVAFFGSYIRYGERHNGVSAAFGQTVAAPVFVGVVLLAFAVVFALGT
jgi:uncharacterized protein DUF3592